MNKQSIIKLIEVFCVISSFIPLSHVNKLFYNTWNPGIRTNFTHFTIMVSSLWSILSKKMLHVKENAVKHVNVRKFALSFEKYLLK